MQDFLSNGNYLLPLFQAILKVFRNIILPTHLRDDPEYILEALRMKKGNKLQTAKLLGISRSALIYRMEKYGIK
jgi:DNA-binding NtrC family response regulator